MKQVQCNICNWKYYISEALKGLNYVYYKEECPQCNNIDYTVIHK